MITQVFLRAMVAPGTRTFMCPPRHRATWLNFLAQGKSLPPAGIELGTFGLQRFESATLSTAPARHIRCASHGSSGSGSGLYKNYTQEGSLWSIVLRCDDHTCIFSCDGCARDPYFYVPVETQSYVIKLSCSRKVLAASGDWTRNLWITTISSQPRYPLRQQDTDCLQNCYC